MRKRIVEEDGVHKEWVAEASEMTLEKLPAFITKLVEEYEHDYGTICHAIASGAIATANAIQRSPSGGISGFQAGCVMWEMIKQWGVFGDGPLRMVDFSDMLYPQYAYKFKSITRHVWETLQAKAKVNLSVI